MFNVQQGIFNRELKIEYSLLDIEHFFSLAYSRAMC